MTMPQPYHFAELTPADLTLLRAWKRNAHVRTWWGSDDEDPENPVNHDSRVARWIVSCDAQPFAYIQDYTVHGWDEHHFAHLPVGARGIDQFIGDPNMLGIGHGKKFIAAHMQTLFAKGAPVIATDPNPDNTRAIAVYQKLGFVPNGMPEKTRWGLIQPMVAKSGNGMTGKFATVAP